MTRIRTLTIAAAISAILSVLSGCASVHEQLTRNHYLSSGRAPEGWTPKESLCPDFARNGWQDHPPSKDGCFAPPPVVVARETKNVYPACDPPKTPPAVTAAKGVVSK